MISRQRSVSATEQSRALFDDTTYFQESVSGALLRTEWLTQAMDRINKCDIVFLDPDNGMAHDGGNQNGVSSTHASYQEAGQLWERGHSLVLYQDMTRRNVPTATREQGCLLRQLLPDSEPIALWYHRRTARILYVIPNPANVEVVGLLQNRVEAFLSCCWGTGRKPHFTRVDC